MPNFSIEPQKNYQFLAENCDVKRNALFCLEGGMRSGKSYDISIFLFQVCMQIPYFYDEVTGLRMPLQSISVYGETWESLKGKAYKDFQEVLKMMGVFFKIPHNKTEHTFTINKVVVQFVGMDKESKAQGATSDIVWINEPVPGFSHAAFIQLKSRARWFTVMDWNPSVPDGMHWCYDVAARKDTKYIKTTILDNKYAPAQTRKEVLSWNPTPENIENGTANERLWQIFGQGMRAAQTGLVYSNGNFIEVESRPDVSQLQLVGYGLDFGFSDDPCAIIALYKFRGQLRGVRPRFYAETIIYETGLQNADIAKRLKESKYYRREYVVCDSAQPKDIEDLYRNHGLLTDGANKSSGSVKTGINALKGVDLLVLRTDPINKERFLYSYKKKHGSDEYTTEIKKGNDHALDALRYCYTELCM